MLRYTLAAPLFDRVELLLDPSPYAAAGRFVIEAPHASDAEHPIEALELEGVPLARPELSHQQVGAGDTLRVRAAASPEL